MKIGVQFEIEETSLLDNGDCVLPNRKYFYPRRFLERQTLPWRELGQDLSRTGSAMHAMLTQFGFAPIRGCSCRSIEGKMNAKSLEWNEEHFYETVERITNNSEKYCQFKTWASAIGMIRDGLMLVVLKSMPRWLVEMAIRMMLRRVLKDERRRLDKMQV